MACRLFSLATQGRPRATLTSSDKRWVHPCPCYCWEEGCFHCICRSGWFSHTFLFYFCGFRHLPKTFQALHLFSIQLDASFS